MPTSPSFSLMPLLGFAAVIVLIPILLWLLKRTPLGGAAAAGVMRSVAMLPVSNTQRIVTIEVGQGAEKRWLVLGVTPNSITTLHTMAPQGDASAIGSMSGAVMGSPLATSVATSFAETFAKLRNKGSDRG